MLFNELRLHGKLAAKRHPMYEKNKIGKYNGDSRYGYIH